MSLPSLFNFPSQQTINTNVSLFDSVGVLSSNHDFINITNNPHLFASISAHDDAHSGLFSGLFGGGGQTVNTNVNVVDVIIISHSNNNIINIHNDPSVVVVVGASLGNNDVHYA
jgi:hypothetical protein